MKEEVGLAVLQALGLGKTIEKRNEYEECEMAGLFVELNRKHK